MARFTVDAETKPGCWVNVYSGNDKQHAHETANFWDERVNVRYVDTVQEELMERARIQSLPLTEQLDELLKLQIKTIDQKADEAIARLQHL